MDVLIQGYGVVGKATHELLKENPKLNIFIHDPYIEAYKNLDDKKYFATFICVNAINDELTGRQDPVSILECLDNARATHTFIRTTVTPGFCGSLNIDNLYHLPEYLRESEGYASSKDLPLITSAPRDLAYALFPSKKIFHYPSIYCEMSKYVHNLFFANKITFFNAVNELCEKKGINYEKLIDVVFETAGKNGSISRIGTMVPGPDGKFGYGGKCLPKDLAAFIKWMDFEEIDIPLKDMLEHTKDLNEVFRGFE